MSDQKRRGSDLQSPSKRHRFAQITTPEEESEDESLILSSPTTSEESSIAAKTLCGYTSEGKVYWRKFKGPDEFTRLFDCLQIYKDYFKAAFHDEWDNSGTESHDDPVKVFHDYLAEQAIGDFHRIKSLLGNTARIQWGFLLDTRADQTEAFQDNLVFTWIEVKKVYPRVVSSKKAEYEQVLRQLVPASLGLDSIRPRSFLEHAFRIDQRRTADGHFPSDAVFKKLIEYYKLFHNATLLSPYTTLIEPSGIGKSFAIAQMAKTHDLYVVYASFADGHSTAFPKRSAIAQEISTLPRERATLFYFWSCYLKAGLLEVEICREIGISPGDFFDLQTSSYYHEYQQSFVRRVRTLFRLSQLRDVKAAGTAETFKRLAERPRKSLLSAKRRLQRDIDSGQKETNFSRAVGIPDALFCIDEARALLDDEGSVPFRSLRAALRDMFGRDNKTKPFELDRTWCDCFGIFLDTTYKVANACPPVRTVRRERYEPGTEPGGHQDWKLFPPIFGIATMDLFVEPGEAQYPDGSEKAVKNLFRTGRPLWGGIIELRNSAKGACLLAISKTRGGEFSHRAMALLSYRLNLHILSNALAESLVPDWLRYVSCVSPGRETMRTTQPSEPILAHIAAMAMDNPGVRYEIVKHFVSASREGSVCLGDGDLDETIAALTILFAFDATYSPSKYNPKAAPLQVFMRSLLGEHAALKISGCVDTDASMRELWANGRVFCNHFAKLQRRPDDKTLAAAFHRGAGLFLPDFFPGADMLLPIWIPDAASGEKVSFLAIQVRNHKMGTYTKHLSSDTESSLARAAQELGLQGRYIGITMALPNDGGKSFDIVQPKKATRGKDTGSYRWSARDKKLLLLVTGFDNDIYPSINSDIVPLLQSLLDCHGRASLPSDPDDRAYASHLMPLEWRPE